MTSKLKPVAFDIETIIDTSTIPLLPPVQADGRMKEGSEKWKQDVDAKRKAQLEKMPLDPRHNLVAVLGWCDGRESGHLMLKDEVSEKEFLERCWKHLGQYNFFISFNGIDFDLPCLRLHSIRHGVVMPTRISSRRYMIENHLDCYQVLSDWQRKPGNMDFYAQYFGVGRGKDAIDGGSVQELWDMGDHETLGSYCENDARQTWAIGQKLMPYYI